MKISIPEWFDASLLPLLEKKVDRSKIKKEDRSLDWVIRQMLKLCPAEWTGIDTKKYGWEDVEALIDENCLSIKGAGYQPDIVIGIKSGGAFIANYVAQCLNVPEVDYMHISHYSGNSRSVVKSTVTSMDKQAVIKEEPKKPIAGKNVLLVDDQTATGSTLVVGVEYMLSKGAKDAKTFCLYSRGPKVDFCTRKGLMVYTPWGKDA